MKNILKLLRRVRIGKVFFGLVFLINILISIGNVAQPYIVKRVIDAVTVNLTQHVPIPVWNFIFVIVSVAVAEQILQFYQQKYQDMLRITVGVQLRDQIFPHILDLSVDYTERHNAGAIIQRVYGGIEALASWLMGVMSYIGSISLTSIFAIIILVHRSWLFGLIFIIFAPLMIVINLRKNRVLKPIREQGNIAWETQAGLFTESIGNLATVKSLSSNEYIHTRFNKSIYKLLAVRLNQFRIERIYNLFRDGTGQLAATLAVIVTIIMAERGHFTPGDVVMVYFYAQNIMTSIIPISRWLNDTAEDEASCKRLVDLLETKPTVIDKPNAQTLESIHSIEFKNVTFSYPKAKQAAIEKVSFKLSGNQTLALVGPSGVGKTTITKLLLRFYEPTNGQILINGEDIHNFTQESVRAHIGMVMQDVALFNTTVEENLRFARPSAKFAELEAAATQAHATEFIDKLKDGYKTLVGERGVKLSGGQKQRVAIARAILKDPQLIILDEATSALDSESERLVQDGLHKLMSKRCAIIIAHRLSTLMHAHQILVLKNGRVIERGNHKVLMAADGLYAKLFKLQSASGKIQF